MSIDDLLKALQDEAVKASSICARYQGTLSMYQAAAMENNGVAADEYRQQLHAILDVMLDNIAVVQMLQRQVLNHRE